MHAGVHASGRTVAGVVKGSLPRSAIKEPSPGFPNAKIVCHAVCPNSRLNARFEGVGCLHMTSRLERRKLHVLSGLVGSSISASDSGFPIHTQEVTGSSPVAPTIRINRLRPHIPEKASTTSTKVGGQLGGLIFLRTSRRSARFSHASRRQDRNRAGQLVDNR